MMGLYTDIRKSQDRRMWTVLRKEDSQTVKALVSKKLLEMRPNDNSMIRLTDIGLNLATKFYVDQEKHFDSQVRVTMKETVKSRSREIDEMAVEVYKQLEPQLEGIASQLKDTMELSHFLAMLGNRIAIFVSLKQGVREDAKEEPNTVTFGICIETAMKMLGDTDGHDGKTWGVTTLRNNAIACLKGEKCPDLYFGTPEEAKAFKTVWRKIQGK